MQTLTTTEPLLNLDRLAFAIIDQARIDWQSKYSREIYFSYLVSLFNSPWFEGLCLLVDCHPKQAQTNLHIPNT